MSITRVTLVFILALAAGSAVAAPLHIFLETPQASITAIDCTQQSIAVAAHGTVLDADAVCPHITHQPRTTRWRPQPHPDGAPIHFTGTIKLHEGVYVHGCALIDYWAESDYSVLAAQCTGKFEIAVVRP